MEHTNSSTQSPTANASEGWSKPFRRKLPLFKMSAEQRMWAGEDTNKEYWSVRLEHTKQGLIKYRRELAERGGRGRGHYQYHAQNRGYVSNRDGEDQLQNRFSTDHNSRQQFSGERRGRGCRQYQSRNRGHLGNVGNNRFSADHNSHQQNLEGIPEGETNFQNEPSENQDLHVKDINRQTDQMPFQKSKLRREKRKKPTIPEQTLEINGKLVDIVYVDGVPVRKEDGERLAKLRNALIGKGKPMSEVEHGVNLAKQCAQKILADMKRNASFKNKQSGCPNESSEETPANKQSGCPNESSEETLAKETEQKSEETPVGGVGAKEAEQKHMSEGKTVTIRGEVFDVVYLDGVPVLKEDAEHLVEVRKKLIAQGLSVGRVIKKLRVPTQRAKKKIALMKKKPKKPYGDTPTCPNQLSEKILDGETGSTVEDKSEEEVFTREKISVDESEKEVLTCEKNESEKITAWEIAELNGKQIDIVYVDGFRIKKEDAEQLVELRRTLFRSGLPMSEVEARVKLLTKSAEKVLACMIKKSKSKHSSDGFTRESTLKMESVPEGESSKINGSDGFTRESTERMESVPEGKYSEIKRSGGFTRESTKRLESVPEGKSFEINRSDGFTRKSTERMELVPEKKSSEINRSDGFTRESSKRMESVPKGKSPGINRSDDFTRESTNRMESVPEGESLEINGKLIQTVYVDGFQVKKRDGARLAQLRKTLVSKGLPMSEVEAGVALAASCAEKILLHAKRKASCKTEQPDDISKCVSQLINDFSLNKRGQISKSRSWYSNEGPNHRREEML